MAVSIISTRHQGFPTSCHVRDLKKIYHDTCSPNFVYLLRGEIPLYVTCKKCALKLFREMISEHLKNIFQHGENFLWKFSIKI